MPYYVSRRRRALSTPLWRLRRFLWLSAAISSQPTLVAGQITRSFDAPNEFPSEVEERRFSLAERIRKMALQRFAERDDFAVRVVRP
jgi:hypothetical protein